MSTWRGAEGSASIFWRSWRAWTRRYCGSTVSFRVFDTLGNQYVERFTNYGIPNDNYWDWHAGFIVTIHGFDFTAAYTGTNLSVQDCLGT